MPGKKKATCDLCCDTLDKGQDILTCEGECGCTVHRYCAGVTKGHFEKLSKSSTPYVCEWCSLKTTQSIIQQLQSEIASLKLELSEAKAALAVRPSTTPQATSSTYAAAASRPPRKTSVNHPTRGGRDWLLSHVSQARNSASTTASRGQRMARVPVQGVRRVWNTYIHASTKSVENAVSRFCKVEGLRIRRKTRTNDRTGKLNWWFIVYGEESTLCELERKWEPLQTQTSWVLEKCTKPSDNTIIQVAAEPSLEQPNTDESQSQENATKDEIGNPTTATTATLTLTPVDPAHPSANSSTSTKNASNQLDQTISVPNATAASFLGEQRCINQSIIANKGHVSVFYFNVRSLLPKIDNLRVICTVYKPCVVCLVETWLDSSIDDVEISIQGYTIVLLGWTAPDMAVASLSVSTYLSHSTMYVQW